MNIANKLTLLRIALIPVFMLLVMLPLDWGQVTLLGATIPVAQLCGAVVFVVASITDYLDGYLARKYQLVTSFGAFFDPMADKLLVLAAFILLVEQGRIPGWIIIIIISRELMVTGLRVLVVQHGGEIMAAALPGKIKTFSQMLAIVFYLLNDIGFAMIGIPFATMMLYLCLFFTVYSGVDYFYHSRFIWNSTN
ncbi:MAG: CDP-diacylglycerol--glycerol-3-phosphate 3-phosphatidyltransferase [Aerococcaceae bacterium]|nr:CDP-diacylglycerol--glycerol-3-phosphate 3-phosphatidyltransferase [Aerococcaceae bacterium]